MSQPFFGALALGLRVEMTGHYPTMAVDGVTLFCNPEFLESITEPEAEGVVAHEVMHCAYMHHTRRQGRNAELWNRACDYAINRDLLKAGFKLPDGALIDSKFDGLGAESIYRALEQAPPPPPQGGKGAGQSGAGKAGNQPAPGNPGQGGQPAAPGSGAPGGKPGAAGNDPGGCGAVLDAAPEHDAAGNAAAESDWQAKVRQAVAVAKAHGAGKVPGALEELVKTLNKPRLDCRAVFRRFIDESASRDYSWMRPNRRHVAAGLYLPGYVPDRPSHIVAVVDSSGSMSRKDVADLKGELQAALDEGAADRVTVAYADTRIQAHATYEPGDAIELDKAPRGGTSFRQPLQWVAEHCGDASAILYMSDMDVSDYGEAPAAPLLWIVTGDPRQGARLAARAPFGESIVLE